MSLASAGLSAYSTMLQAKGTASADEYQSAKLEQAATYGDLKAVQTGGQMTRNLNQTLGKHRCGARRCQRRSELADGRRLSLQPGGYRNHQ